MISVSASNIEQLRAWDGPQGEFWAARHDRLDAGVAAYDGHFFAAAAIGTGEYVLDIGCGSGKTTRHAARRAGAGAALGVDLSSRLVGLAREIADREHVANVTFAQADAQIHPFTEGGFDVAVSRCGAMFFGRPPVAFANIARAVRPGGRLVLLAWQAPSRNEWAVAFPAALSGERELPAPPPSMPGPFALSEPDSVRRLLASSGFTDVRVRGLTEPMYFGRDARDACRFVFGQYGWLTRGLDTGARAEALDRLHTTMTAHEGPDGVRYESATWLIEARRE